MSNFNFSDAIEQLCEILANVTTFSYGQANHILRDVYSLPEINADLPLPIIIVQTKNSIDINRNNSPAQGISVTMPIRVWYVRDQFPTINTIISDDLAEDCEILYDVIRNSANLNGTVNGINITAIDYGPGNDINQITAVNNYQIVAGMIEFDLIRYLKR